MSEPWAVSKVAHTSTTDIDPEAKADALVFDGFIAKCILKTTEALEKASPPGFTDFQRQHLCEIFRSMKWTHNSVRTLLSKEVHPSSIDAMPVTRVQLETLYAICLMVEQAKTITDYVKNGWKKMYTRFLLERQECKNLPRFQEFLYKTAEPYLSYLQNLIGVTAEERATIEKHELGTPMPKGISEVEIPRFPTPAGVIRKVQDNARKDVLLRLYPEYQYFSSFVHGSPDVTMHKSSFDDHSKFSGLMATGQKEEMLQRLAGTALFTEYLAVVQSATEVATLYATDVELNGTVAEAWKPLIDHSLLGRSIWEIRSKKALGVIS